MISPQRISNIITEYWKVGVPEVIKNPHGTAPATSYSYYYRNILVYFWFGDGTYYPCWRAMLTARERHGPCWRPWKLPAHTDRAAVKLTRHVSNNVLKHACPNLLTLLRCRAPTLRVPRSAQPKLRRELLVGSSGRQTGEREDRFPLRIRTADVDDRRPTDWRSSDDVKLYLTRQVLWSVSCHWFGHARCTHFRSISRPTLYRRSRESFYSGHSPLHTTEQNRTSLFAWIVTQFATHRKHNWRAARKALRLINAGGPAKKTIGKNQYILNIEEKKNR